LIAEIRLISTADANERELRKTAKKASEPARKCGLSARETKPKATKHHARISATKYSKAPTGRNTLAQGTALGRGAQRLSAL
jgi:hypothetical protein